jgi:hypothetical protein
LGALSPPPNEINVTPYWEGVCALTASMFNDSSFLLYHSPPSSAEVKNEWICTSTPHTTLWRAQGHVYFYSYPLFISWEL